MTLRNSKHAHPMNFDAIAILARGIVGTSLSGAALATSMASDVKYWMQVTSLGIGIGVGILTAISLIKSLRK